MTIPNGGRADSMRIPKASRAGALHRYLYLYLQRQNFGPIGPNHRLGSNARAALPVAAPQPNPAGSDEWAYGDVR